jgi:trehalose 2-sulfotransferase
MTSMEMATDVSRSYTIAFTMRSGSNELCGLLARNGFGIPGELFRDPLPRTPNLPGYESFRSIVIRYQRNGVFGSKMSHDHRAALDEYLRAVCPGYRQIGDVLPEHRWIWLSRRDKILQAISLCRAEISGKWAATEDPTNEFNFNYDFFHVLSRVMLLLSADFAWKTYFDAYSVQPLIVMYEDFFEDVPRQLERIINYLGGRCPAYDHFDIEKTYRIQRTLEDLDLRDRFAADLCKVGSLEMKNKLGPDLERWLCFFERHGWH